MCIHIFCSNSKSHNLNRPCATFEDMSQTHREISIAYLVTIVYFPLVSVSLLHFRSLARWLTSVWRVQAGSRVWRRRWAWRGSVEASPPQPAPPCLLRTQTWATMITIWKVRSDGLAIQTVYPLKCGYFEWQFMFMFIATSDITNIISFKDMNSCPPVSCTRWCGRWGGGDPSPAPAAWCWLWPWIFPCPLPSQ